MRHRVFSPRRVGAIAGNTFTELTRLKVFHALLLFALILIGSSAILARLSFQEEFQVLQDISLGAMSFFTSLLAILATAHLLPQVLEDRTIYTVLAKPVPRFEYLIGKLAGVLALLAISVVLLSALFFAVLRFRRHAAFNPNLLPGIALIYLKSVLLATLTLLISTFATSNLFTVVVAIFVYFIGYLQATAREFWLQEQGGTWLTHLFLAFVALIFPDLQQFDLTDATAGAAVVPIAIFCKTGLLAGFYFVWHLLVAIAVFNRREL